jgi:prevent-host-death family protein
VLRDPAAGFHARQHAAGQVSSQRLAVRSPSVDTHDERQAARSLTSGCSIMDLPGGGRGIETEETLMTQVTLEEAGAQLGRLIEEASRGEEVIIVQDDRPVAKIIPLTQAKPREPGSAKDLILHIADDFNAPLEDFKEYS